MISEWNDFHFRLETACKELQCPGKCALPYVASQACGMSFQYVIFLCIEFQETSTCPIHLTALGRGWQKIAFEKQRIRNHGIQIFLKNGAVYLSQITNSIEKKRRANLQKLPKTFYISSSYSPKCGEKWEKKCNKGYFGISKKEQKNLNICEHPPTQRKTFSHIFPRRYYEPKK